MRLIQTLANTAAKNWRALERNQRFRNSDISLTPLPVIINLLSGAREFWGDGDVYRWFRPNASGPKPVMSAMMALELWMEQEIEAGRDIDALFEKVLSGSECVATLGICLSMTLANPQTSLSAALPIVSSPAIWLMDLRRFTGDLIGSFGGDPFGRDRSIYEIQAARDKLPQRRLEIRRLATYYLFRADESLSSRFEQAVARFAEDLPFAYEEQKDNPGDVAWLKDQMQLFQSYGDRANYRFYKTEQCTEVEFAQPQHIIERYQEEQATLATHNLWIRVNMWAHKTIESGKAADSITIAQAVAAAKQLQQPEDFRSPYDNSGGNRMNWRLQAIAGTAAACLIADFDWTQKQGLLKWCRDILLAAAMMKEEGDLLDSREGGLDFEPKVSAARGLGEMVARGLAHAEIQKALLHLTAETHYNVTGAVFLGLRQAWNVDGVLCWNALSLGLSLCMLPKTIKPKVYLSERSRQETDWTKKTLQTHLKNLKRNNLPAIPRIQKSSDINFLWKLAERIIGGLPIEALIQDSESRIRLLRLVDDLISWTVDKHTPNEKTKGPRRNPRHHRERIPHLWEWNKFLFSWSSRLANFLTADETKKHLLDPVRASWVVAPLLTADLLQYYFFTNIATASELSAKAQVEWGAMCDWVLSDLQQDLDWQSDDRDRSEAVSMIIFVHHDMALFEGGWQHIGLFADVINKWVDVVGGNADTYSSLLIMLSEAGQKFFPEPALSWLTRHLKTSSPARSIFKEHKNGQRTAELLQRMWHITEDRIRSDTDTLQRYSELLDQLTPMAIPLASLLQQKLERRS